MQIQIEKYENSNQIDIAGTGVSNITDHINNSPLKSGNMITSKIKKFTSKSQEKYTIPMNIQETDQNGSNVIKTDLQSGSTKLRSYETRARAFSRTNVISLPGNNHATTQGK